MQIDLSDNKIADGLDTLVKQAPGITHLHLAGNKIKDVDALKPLVRPFPITSSTLFLLHRFFNLPTCTSYNVTSLGLHSTMCCDCVVPVGRAQGARDA